jgi:hypothetical protein
LVVVVGSVVVAIDPSVLVGAACTVGEVVAVIWVTVGCGLVVITTWLDGLAADTVAM